MSDVQHIKIPGLIEYKIWAEDYRNGFQILWQNEEMTARNGAANVQGWSHSFDKMDVASYDHPELMFSSVCLRGRSQDKDDLVSYRQVSSYTEGQQYVKKVIKAIEDWSNSKHAQPAIQRWMAENCPVEQMDLFD